MHELFEHTADLGLRVIAADKPTLFAEAAAGLMTALLDNPEAVEPRQTHTLHIAGTEPDYLLFDWLRAVLVRFEVEQFLLATSRVELTADGLTAVIAGEPLDRSRHQLSHEVKAITYHGLKLEPHGDGWLAEVIVDI